MADIELRKTKQITAKHFSNLKWLRKHRFSIAVTVVKNSIVNLPNYELSDTEQFVLAYGLEFCLPPTKINREEIFAEFKVLIGQLLHHTPKSKENASALLAKLNTLAYVYCDYKID